MATIGTCKANLTKAHTSLEAARGKVPQELLNPFNNESVSPDEERQLPEYRQDSLRTHLTNMRAVLRNKEADNDAYVEYMQESRVEESIVTAERLSCTPRKPGGSMRTQRTSSVKTSRLPTGT
ncbi:hypothetical protein GCK32_018462 [Trichostrongylus colubriformis]|uniref:Uncharacterized protein n=1 Tax=Trichostrongylus colubriformis TaxID=6319 RepID=A0AAN8EUV0_TRICO